MRICLLTTQDLDADPFPANDWPCDPRPFLPDAAWHLAVLEKSTSVESVTALAKEGYDLYFNLCDGAADENRPGIEVVRTLERLNVPFTGATSEYYEPSREDMKRACRAQGIASPAYVLAREDADVERAAEELRFPLFVKHPSSYASVSLSRASRVKTPAGLRRQVRKIMSRHGSALIEEYIDGIECTVLVAENPDDLARPTTYTPMQYRFPEGESFKHVDMKWVDYDAMSSFPVEDPVLDAKLRDVAARFFLEIKGASFGRCDIRVDSDGTPFMLEINPNCGVYYPPTDPGSADLCLARDPAGHEGFTRQIVQAALRRHERRNGSRRPRTSDGAPVDFGPWRLTPLFVDRTKLTAVADSVLEGHLGRAVVADATDLGAARLDVGCYAIFGGDASSTVARRLVEGVSGPLELAYPDSPEWEHLLRDVHGPRLSDRSMRFFVTDGISLEELARMAGDVPEGFTVDRLDVARAASLDEAHRPNGLQVFDGPSDLVARGIGFCAVRDEKVACVASSYTYCTGRIELAIATHPDHRRLGLARSVAARLTLHCLERGIAPHWNAANPVSQHLAVSLGYRPAGICPILYLEA